MQAALVQRARARRSCLKHLAPLKTLSRRAIVSHLTYYRDKRLLFTHLPWDILESLLDACPIDLKDEWEELLTKHNHAQELSIDIDNNETVPEVCSHIQETYTSLRELCLSCYEEYNNGDDISPSAEAISKLLVSLPELRVLELKNLPVNDEVVKAIETFKQLRTLKLQYCYITVCPERMCDLFLSCTEIVEFGYCGTNYNFVKKQALLSLKNLQDIGQYGLLQILAELASLKPKLKLRYIELDADRFNINADFSPSALVEMLPCIRVLGLSRINDVAPFLNLKHVTELYLCGMPYKSLFQTYAANLTRLHLYQCSGDVDLSMIGHLCVNVEDLFISDANVNPKCAYKLGPEHFSKLTRVHLSSLSPQSDATMPEVESVMHRMLSAPKLSSFHSNFPPLVSPALLHTLIAEAQEGGVVFSQLVYFFVKMHEGFSLDLAVQLICSTPKMESLLIYSMSVDVANQIYSFVNANFPEIFFNSIDYF